MIKENKKESKRKLVLSLIGLIFIDSRYGNCYNKNMNRKTTPKRINSVSEIADGGIDNERDGYTEYASKRLLESLSEKEILRQDRLISRLSMLYGRRKGRWLSNFLMEEESNDWNRDYSTGVFTYVNDLKLANPDEMHDFARWYDYALKRFARE